MNTKELYSRENGKFSVVAYYCGNCKTIHKNKEDAEECCKPLICTKCGKAISRDRTKNYMEGYVLDPIRCYDCYEKDKWNQTPILTEEEYLKLCKDQPDLYGPVVIGDEWGEDLYTLLEDIQDDYDEAPDYIELAQYEKLDPICIERVLENKIDNMGLEESPDFDEVYKDWRELVDYIKKFNEKQTYTYWARAGKRITLSDKTKEEYFGDKE